MTQAGLGGDPSVRIRSDSIDDPRDLYANELDPQPDAAAGELAHATTPTIRSVHLDPSWRPDAAMRSRRRAEPRDRLPSNAITPKTSSALSRSRGRSSTLAHGSDSEAGEVRFDLWDDRTAGAMQESASHGETAAAVATR